MKKINLLLVAILFVGVFALTGCKKDPTKDFKNPKTITVETKKGTTKITYDDDGTYEEDESYDAKVLKNKDNDFRLYFEYADLTTKDAKTRLENFSKDKNYKIIKDVEFNGYKGFALTQKTYGSTQVYLYLDEAKDVVFVIQISPMNSSDYEKGIKEGTNPEDALYKKEKVQQILKTITYEK